MWGEGSGLVASYRTMVRHETVAAGCSTAGVFWRSCTSGDPGLSDSPPAPLQALCKPAADDVPAFNGTEICG